MTFLPNPNANFNREVPRTHEQSVPEGEKKVKIIFESADQNRKNTSFIITAFSL